MKTSKFMTPYQRVLSIPFVYRLTNGEKLELATAFMDAENYTAQKENAACARICDNYVRQKSDESKEISPTISLIVTGECAASEYLGSRIRDRIRKEVIR